MKPFRQSPFLFFFRVLIGPCGIETKNHICVLSWLLVLIGPCGIETAQQCEDEHAADVLIGPCGIETSVYVQGATVTIGINWTLRN